jgi:hypothetical protein
MGPEFVTLIVVFAVGVAIGVARGKQKQRDVWRANSREFDAWRVRNRWRWNKRSGNSREFLRKVILNPPVGPSSPWSPKPDPKVHDAADQLRIVMGATFTIQPLLNKKEARVFKELDRIVTSCNPAWQVMAQVSLGEVLRSKDAEAYSCINSKRVDRLLMDGDCQPRHAIEYQGMSQRRGRT